MEGFLTKEQAARILGVSTRQVDNYIRDQKLRRVKDGGRAWVPKSDVELLYSKKSLKSVHLLDEYTTLRRDVDQLQLQVKILQRGLGFARSQDPRSDIDLRLLYQSTIDSLAEEGWPLSQVMKFTEELSSIREEDTEGLLQIYGPTALLPFFDLARRMICYVEGHDQYPSHGTKAVRDRLVKARRVLLALVEITMRVETPVFTAAASELYAGLRETADPISAHIGAYIARTA